VLNLSALLLPHLQVKDFAAASIVDTYLEEIRIQLCEDAVLNTS